MSMEGDCESIMIALIAGHADVITDGISVVRYDEDADAESDAIIVKGMPREVMLASHTQTDPAVWRVPCEVQIYLVTRDAERMKTLTNAVQEATSGTASPAAVTIAASQFPNGIELDDTDEGTRENDEEARVRSQTWNFVLKAA